MGVQELSGVLWRERQLLDTLLFRLEAKQLILASGRTRWLAQATHEVELARGRLRAVELDRAIEADSAAVELGVGRGSSLLELARAAPRPWDELLVDHRDAFVLLTGQIQEAAESNRRLLADDATPVLQHAPAQGATS